MSIVTHVEAQAHVYLEGDPSPVSTSLTVEAVVAKLLDVQDDVRRGELVFIRLPLVDGREGLVNPLAIVSILPPLLEEGTEVEDKNKEETQ